MKVGTDAMILGALIDSKNKRKALDIGCGTGILSLMVAQRNTEVKIQAIEIDRGSAEDALLNFRNSPWSNQLEVLELDFLEYSSQSKFDLIFSNPPYFENGLHNDSQLKTKARHEDSLPLIELFQKVGELLEDNGHFWVILPFETSAKWKKNAEELNLYCASEITVDGKSNLPKRTIFCFSKQKVDAIQAKLVIRNDDNSYTEQYKKLTIDFHGVKL